MNEVLGVDIGGTGIKIGLVDVRTGSLIGDAIRVKTPKDSSPENVAEIIHENCEYLNYKGNIGIGFPGVIQGDFIRVCNNLSSDWIDLNASEYFSKQLSCNVTLLNDVDAAGYGEMFSGAGKGNKDKVIVICIGTGIGTALFYNGKLFPGTEFGQMFLRNKKVAEKFAANSTRKNLDLSWEEWGSRLNIFLTEVYSLIYPDLIILSGGVSKKHEKYQDYLKLDCEIQFALHKNRAGVIGAAMAAANLDL